MSDAFYTMKKVTDKTGLNHHVIRVWEKRYNAITPKRTESNRRVYTEEDVTKLEFLKILTDNGYPISQIANKNVEDLSELIVKERLNEEEQQQLDDLTSENDPEEVINLTIHYLKKFDTQQIEKLLLSESTKYSQFDFITKIFEPLLIRVGHLWSTGELRVSHEHLVSAMVKMILMNFKNANLVTNHTKSVIFTTPSGQLHELGALMGAVITSAFGLNAIYLGPNLPVEEIVFSVHENNAKSVVLSIIYPLDDESINTQLERLASLIKTDTDIIITCKKADIYMETIDKIGAKLIPTFEEFNTYIQHLE